MYRVYCNLASLNSLLALTDAEYLDAIFAKDHVSLINNSTEIFGCLTLTADSSANDTGNVSCRIPRKILKDLFIEGFFDVLFSDDSVEMKFRDGAEQLQSSVTFIRQNIFSETYAKKLQLITKLEDKVPVPTESIASINKIAKTANTIINCNKGLIGVYLGSNMRVYQKIEGSPSYSVTASSFSHLRRCSANLFSLQNYLGAANDNLVLLATKARDTLNDEFYLIEEEKSKFECTVDLLNIVQFVNRVKPKVDSLILDLEKQECVLDINHIIYRVPVTVCDSRIAPGASFDKISIPLSLFSTTINNLTNKKCKLSKKRYFVRLDNEELVILF